MRTLAGAMVLAALALAGTAQAEDTYPSNPITVVVPSSAGGGSDTVARIFAAALTKQLDKTVIVQDLPGAGGMIGQRFVARARPDGYTLLMHHVSLATTPALYKNIQFDPLTSFDPIGLFADTPLIVVSSKGFPPRNLKELVDYVHHSDKPITFASSGEGSATYLCALLFEKVVGKKITMVGYKGAAPALVDVESGRVNLLCDVTASIAPYVKSGEVKPFVLTATKRLASLPNLPTASEAGLKDLTMSAWYGLYAPAGTPKSVIDRLEKSLQAVNRDPAVAKQLSSLESVVFDPSEATPAALHERLASQLKLWTPIILKAKAEADKDDGK
jgi:tripartite-type tricarboxylate transporter receptor subunit TctC